MVLTFTLKDWFAHFNLHIKEFTNTPTLNCSQINSVSRTHLQLVKLVGTLNSFTNIMFAVNILFNIGLVCLVLYVMIYFTPIGAFSIAGTLSWMVVALILLAVYSVIGALLHDEVNIFLS